MAKHPTAQLAVEALRSRGDASGTGRWPDGDPDYVAEYSLTSEHIPTLISLATQWGDEPPENEAVYGPVHAWRALGQLRAVDAVQPLLDVQDELDELDELEDDWYLEEFHHVFGLIGPPAIEPLAAFLADESHNEFPRVKAANGLYEIVRRFPETREPIVAILTAELARHQIDLGALNGFLVSDLLKLEAIESAETIERAFAANAIDPRVAGDWGDIRRELNVPGLGIASDRSAGWPSMEERFGFADTSAEQRRLASERRKQHYAKRRAKAKRKQQKKDRKRSQKPR
ncbi:MAG: hypothetical protein ABIU95_07600 [Burkholderiales bacterium]